MFKAIKNGKIIAINTKNDFRFLSYDKIIEDNEHILSDYKQYNGEFLLSADIPAPTLEEQKENRARAYQLDVDPITAHIQRLRDKEQTSEIIIKIDKLIIERDEKVQEIVEKYPYPVDNLENIE